jgi:SAM-dependent methyltransferase
MLELIIDDTSFHGMANLCHEPSLFARIFLSFVVLFGLALLIMTLVSMLSYVMGGAPFIGTSKGLTRKIVKLAGIQPGEYVYDLGCGDGRFLIEANKTYGATAIGIEISPVIWALARLTVWIHGANVVLHCVNLKNYDFSDADVIFCYLVPDMLEMLAKRFDRLKPGSRIISRRFEIPERQAIKCIKIRKGFGAETIYIYQIQKRS